MKFLKSYGNYLVRQLPNDPEYILSCIRNREHVFSMKGTIKFTFSDVSKLMASSIKAMCEDDDFIFFIVEKNEDLLYEEENEGNDI